MEAQPEKVYVAIGTDIQDGFETLKWALIKWNSCSISIVILYAAHDISKEYVNTPLGKLPASSISDEKLKVIRMIEERKIDNLLSNYVAFCGKVKAEIFKIEKHDEPIHKSIVELISELGIKKLVMGITFMKSSSWKSRSAISGSFYVHRHKPELCELFIICGGKLVFLREENNGGLKEEDDGVMVGKVRENAGFKGWLGKMKSQNIGANDKNLLSSPSPSTSNDPVNRWRHCALEIENYLQQLLSSNSDEEDCVEEIETLEISPKEADTPENMNAADKIEVLKLRIAKAQEVIKLKRKQTKDNVERQARAEWAICLCSRQVEELEASTKREKANHVELKKDLDTAKEELHEVHSEVEEKKSKLNSVLELRGELSNKLQLSFQVKSRAEAELERVVSVRAEMVRKIEDLRRMKDLLQCRIEFCREKDAIEMATRRNDHLEFDREFTAEEIRVATNDFLERFRLKSDSDTTSVYKGKINSTTVAIKVYNAVNGLSQEAFQAKVKLLSHIRHPHLVAMVGFCSDLKCIVFEYMHNGSLRDALLAVHRSSRRRNRGPNWHARIRIAAEVCSGLGFLHSAQPMPIAHGSLSLSKILLDRNHVAKIYGPGIGLGWCSGESNVRADIRAFGNLVLQLLTGKNLAEPAQRAVMMDCEAVVGALDEMAGEWPLELAMELARIAKRCLSTNEGVATIGGAIREVRKRADELAADGGCEVDIGGRGDVEDSSNVPKAFLCPIFQDVMKNPQVAADGISYELEAMEKWLGTGHDTSPMTNLKLNHKMLTPNHTLRSLIQDWLNKPS